MKPGNSRYRSAPVYVARFRRMYKPCLAFYFDVINGGILRFFYEKKYLCFYNVYFHTPNKKPATVVAGRSQLIGSIVLQTV